jgi:hypothetical protein
MDTITNQEFKIVKPAMDTRWIYLVAVFILFFFLANWIRWAGTSDGALLSILLILFVLFFILPAIWIRTVPKNHKTIGKLKFNYQTIEIENKTNVEKINISDLISLDFRFSGTLGESNGSFNTTFGQIAREDGSGNILTLNTKKSSYNLNLFLVSRKQKIELEQILITIKTEIDSRQHII